MDYDGSTIIHPNLPTFTEYNNGDFDSFISTDIANIEPTEFVNPYKNIRTFMCVLFLRFSESGLRDKILESENQSYESIYCTIKHEAGSVQYDGKIFILI